MLRSMEFNTIRACQAIRDPEYDKGIAREASLAPMHRKKSGNYFAARSAAAR